MININPKCQNRSPEKGAVLISMVLMVLIASFVSSTTFLTAITSQRVVSNSLHEREAFENAEAGVEYAVMYGKNNLTTITTDSDGDGYINYSVPTVAGTNYSITYTNPTMNNFYLLEIRSIGTSADGTATQTIRQRVYRENFMPQAPPAGLIAHETVLLNGNVSVNNAAGTAIWSGSTTSTGRAVRVRGGIQQNDTDLANLTNDQFFNNFFNQSKDAAKLSANIVFDNAANTNYSSAYPTGIDGVTGKVIYIKQASGTSAVLNSNAVIGSSNDPVILIVDGDLTFNGNVRLYGALYVAGNWYNTGGGTASIYGAAIVEGNMSSEGTPDIVYTNNLSNLNKLVSLVKVPGTWRDF